MVSTKFRLTRAVFAMSIRVFKWQPGPQNLGSTTFRKKKKRPDFLKFIGPVTSLLVLQPSEIMHIVFTEFLLAIAVFARSIKVLG